MVIWDHRPRIKGGLQVSNMKVKCAMTGMIHNTPNILFSECGLRSISPYWKMGELKHFEFGKMGVCGSKNESHSQISQWVWIEQEPDFAGTIGFDVIMWCKMSTSGWHLAWTFHWTFLQIHWGDPYELRRSVHPGDLPFTDEHSLDLVPKLDPKLEKKRTPCGCYYFLDFVSPLRIGTLHLRMFVCWLDQYNLSYYISLYVIISS